MNLTPKGRLSVPAPTRQHVMLEIPGAMIAHKNLWKPKALRKGSKWIGTLYLLPEHKKLMADWTMIIRAAWKRPPCTHPRCSVLFYVEHRAIDKDGMYATVCDLLQKGGVIKNDNIAHHNGEVSVLPAVVDKKNPRTVVNLWFEPVK